MFLADNIIDQLYRNPTLLKLISKHLGWGIFKNAINEPMDGDYENIYEAYMNLMKESGREFEEPGDNDLPDRGIDFRKLLQCNSVRTARHIGAVKAVFV